MAGINPFSNAPPNCLCIVALQRAWFVQAAAASLAQDTGFPPWPPLLLACLLSLVAGIPCLVFPAWLERPCLLCLLLWDLACDQFPQAWTHRDSPIDEGPLVFCNRTVQLNLVCVEPRIEVVYCPILQALLSPHVVRQAAPT